MTTVLNRKFDLLCHSGTCPSYLVDVLSLLVAHANDTELFKLELRNGSSGAVHVGNAGTFASASPGLSVGRPDQLSRDMNERNAADRRTQLMYRQVEDPEALDDALRASHETVLIAAERSLQTYAEDLKHVNEVAMATSAKQLRSMRVETQQQMSAFRERVCASMVEQTRDELEVMRSELVTSVKEDVSETVGQLHDVSMRAQQQVQEVAASFTQFVAESHAAMTIVPLEEAHEALVAVEYVQEQLDAVEASAATQAEVEMLEARLKDLERVVAALGSAVSTPQVDTTTTLPILLPVAGAAKTVSEIESLSTNGGASGPAPLSSGGAQAELPPKPSARPAPRAQVPRSATAKDATPPPQPAPQHPSLERRSCAERIGVVVEAAEDGVVILDVLPDSPAVEQNLGASHIISHVGRVAVTTPAAFEAALAAVDGHAVKLTTFDPFQGRVRVVTVPSW